MNPIELTKYYFEISNKSDFYEIKKLLEPNTTYSSQNIGLYLGVDSIIDMQKKFHWSFEKLEWKILKIVEEKEWIVRIEFDFVGLKEWEDIKSSGIEYVIVLDEKIQHIEIKNK